MSHTTLGEHYKLQFAMMQHHKWAISDIENLIPFERDLYVEMLLRHLEEQKKEMDRK